MTLQLAYVGLAMVATGVATFYAVDRAAPFILVNLIAGALALAAAGVLALRRLRLASSPDSLRAILLGGSRIALALIAGVGLERAADHSGVHFDWTFERRFEIAASTIEACNAAGTGLRATLYHAAADPRVRRTRILLETLGRGCSVQVDSRSLERAATEIDRFAIGSSNTVVFELGPRFETVERPSEGAIYAALRRLRPTSGTVLVALRGEGEGDFERVDDAGYSDLLEALSDEGYRVRAVVTASISAIPEEAEAVVVLGPRRLIQPQAIDALRRYLETGGSLVALIEPGSQTGLEELLAEYGLAS
ncbi:MAG: Gldg family protein, partial [Myxococcota bacterium]